MKQPPLTMAQQVARAVIDHQEQRTGHAPDRATVVLSHQTLVVTLYNALSPAEMALARSAAGATHVQEFHRQLFATSVDPLREEINRITGVEVREAAAEMEAVSGAIVHAFTCGSVVQVFLLAHAISDKDWNGYDPITA